MKTQCPLCGTRFDTGDNEGCRACPRFMKCGLILCPNCGHEFPLDKRRKVYIVN